MWKQWQGYTLGVVLLQRIKWSDVELIKINFVLYLNQSIYLQNSFLNLKKWTQQCCYIEIKWTDKPQGVTD